MVAKLRYGNTYVGEKYAYWETVQVKDKEYLIGHVG